MADRFFLESPPTDGQAKLAGAEAHHLLHVMRAKPGDEVTLFDGGGGEYTASIVECGRTEVLLDVGPRRAVSRELRATITMAVALPKGDRQKWLVEKLTELGVRRLVPIGTERSVAERKGKSLERLERAVVEASKQCGRNQLMQIAPPAPMSEVLAIDAGVKLLAHPGGAPLASVELPEAGDVAVLVGPEGGFSEAEVSAAVQHGWQEVSLGPSILRIETAAVTLAAVLASRSG